MSKPLSSTALAAGMLALLSIGTPDAQAKQQCRPAIPSSQHGYWSYRIIDGRKCWYEGKPGLSKELLEWSSEELKRAPSEEVKRTPREEVKEDLKGPPKRAPREEVKQDVKPELKPEVKRELKQEAKPELKRAPKEELKEALGEEDSAQPPAFRTKPERIAAEKPRGPLDAQAWAPKDPDTFDALWRSRVQNFR